MDARIYAGLHYRHSLVEGFRLGHEVAEQISRKFFLLLPGRTKPKIAPTEVAIIWPRRSLAYCAT